MSADSVPDWTASGILPPYDRAEPTSFNRSPYNADLTDIVLRFGTSPERVNILDGLLNFRSQLHKIGIVEGFQWIDGSFLEDIESLESRAPRDVDVVTFFVLPEGENQASLLEAYPDVFSSYKTKQHFKVDAHFVELNPETPDILVFLSSYWYSIWSHRRDESWKGFLQIDLSCFHDAAARANLENMVAQGGQP